MHRLDYELRAADLEALQYHLATRPAVCRAVMQRYLLLLLVLPVLVMLVAWVAGGFQRLQPSAGQAIVALLPSLIGLTVIPFFGAMRRSAARRVTAMQIAGSAKDVLTGPMRMAVSPDGIEVIAAGARSLYFWRSVDGLEQTGEHLFILLGPQVAIVVPMRHQDTAAIAALCTALAAGIARRDEEAMRALEAPELTGRGTSP